MKGKIAIGVMKAESTLLQPTGKKEVLEFLKRKIQDKMKAQGLTHPGGAASENR